jgi:hypothetical protein
MWFADQDEEIIGVAKGYIKIRDILSIDQSTKSPRQFDICVKRRTYEFCAISEAECIDWISVITAWAKFSDLSMHIQDTFGETAEEVNDKKILDTKIPFSDNDVVNFIISAEVNEGVIASSEPKILDSRCEVSPSNEILEVEDVDSKLIEFPIANTEVPLSVEASNIPSSSSISSSESELEDDIPRLPQRESISSPLSRSPYSSRQSKLLRRSVQLPKAWITADASTAREDSDSDEELLDGRKSDLPVSPVLNRPRRASDIADTVFIRLNSQSDKDDFVNKLKTNSYRDLSEEYWLRHKWYLAMVVCFVTLQVLRVTSFILRELQGGF